MVVLCEVKRIGGHCGWPQCLGPAPCKLVHMQGELMAPLHVWFHSS